ncbi:hypothetical protein PGB90_003829 [Kerria lacca]
MFEYYSRKQLLEYYAEFNATEESVKTDINYLKEWLEKEPHLPDVKDEEILLNVLIRGKHQLERAKKMLDSYYSSRTIMGDLFKNRDPRLPEIKNAMNYACYIPLPKLTPDGYRVIIFRIFHHNNESMPIATDFMKALHMQLDLNFKQDRVKGAIFIYDFENLTMPFVILQLTVLKKALEVGLVELWEKRSTDMCEILSKNILPTNYGGSENSVEEIRDLYYRHLTEYTDWFLSQENIKADLSKKPKTDRCNNDISLYGTDGSFRKILLD